MIHTVKIDDSTSIGKKIIKDLRRFRNVVIFENQIMNDISLDEYVTAEEFRTAVKENIFNYCKVNGKI